MRPRPRAHSAVALAAAGAGAVTPARWRRPPPRPSAGSGRRRRRSGAPHAGRSGGANADGERPVQRSSRRVVHRPRRRQTGWRGATETTRTHLSSRGGSVPALAARRTLSERLLGRPTDVPAPLLAHQRRLQHVSSACGLWRLAAPPRRRIATGSALRRLRSAGETLRRTRRLPVSTRRRAGCGPCGARVSPPFSNGCRACGRTFWQRPTRKGARQHTTHSEMWPPPVGGCMPSCVTSAATRP